MDDEGFLESSLTFKKLGGSSLLLELKPGVLLPCGSPIISRESVAALSFNGGGGGNLDSVIAPLLGTEGGGGEFGTLGIGSWSISTSFPNSDARDARWDFGPFTEVSLGY